MNDEQIWELVEEWREVAADIKRIADALTEMAKTDVGRRELR